VQHACPTSGAVALSRNPFPLARYKNETNYVIGEVFYSYSARKSTPTNHGLQQGNYAAVDETPHAFGGRPTPPRRPLVAVAAAQPNGRSRAVQIAEALS
jgi:hypothetical protein